MISRKSVEQLRAAIFIGNLEAKSERDAILKMLGALQGHPQVKDLSELSAATFDRQQSDPPLFPGGIAFPHARTNSVSSLVVKPLMGDSTRPFDAQVHSVGALARAVPLSDQPKHFELAI